MRDALIMADRIVERLQNKKARTAILVPLSDIGPTLLRMCNDVRKKAPGEG